MFRNPHGLPARGHYTTAHDLADARESDHRRVPGLLQPLRRARVQLQRHRAAQPQRAAVARPERRRHEDRLYGSRRLLPRDFGRARRHAPDRRRAGRAERPGCATTARRSCSSTASRTSRRTSSTRRGQELDNARVWGGEPEYARLGLTRTSTSRSRAARTRSSRPAWTCMAELAAPLVRGTAVGEVKVSFAGAPLVKSPLVVLTNVMDGGVWARMRDELQSFGNERRRRVAAEVSDRLGRSRCSAATIPSFAPPSSRSSSALRQGLRGHRAAEQARQPT